jgi:16S rRNA (guanine966-N2)-methyltransferase
MRIIAGEFRGRRIRAPEGHETRPMLDRVREALFSTLGDLVPGARVIDLFAGTGSLGLEALSRGAASTLFVESDRRASLLLADNIALLGVEDTARVARADALDPCSWTDPGASDPPPTADLLLLDPPYVMFRRGAVRAKVLEGVVHLHAAVLAPGGALVLHTHARELEAHDFAGLTAEKRTYGTSALWYLWKPLPPPEAG